MCDPDAAAARLAARATFVAALVALGVAAAWPLPAQSQQACTACVAATGCEARRDSCIAECRARLFSIDPKRNACVAGCSTSATQCARTAEATCRTRGQCP